MLILTFHFGNERRGIPHDRIVEVVALVDLTPVGPAPPGIAGAFNYHGRWVPTLDLSTLTGNPPSSRRWSTRIIILQPTPPDSAGRPIGLIAETATEMMQRTEKTPGPPELDLVSLLNPELRAWLDAFREPPPADTSAPRRRGPRRPRHYHAEA